MVPVFLDGVRVGHFQVDIPVTQRELVFRKADYVEFGPRIHTSLATMPEITEVRIPLEKFNLAIPEVEIADLNTTGIQKILRAKGAPVYSNNIERSISSGGRETIYSWRVANVTLDQLEEVFDLEQYIPE